MTTDVLAALFARYKPHRAHLANDESTLVQQLGLQNWRKIIRAFGSGHIECYRQPGENPTNHRYRNVILTNALNQKLWCSGIKKVLS